MDNEPSGTFVRARKCALHRREVGVPVNDPDWADRMDALAQEHSVSLLGTGVNPLRPDALIVMWTSACLRIDRIGARVNDLSPSAPRS